MYIKQSYQLKIREQHLNSLYEMNKEYCHSISSHPPKLSLDVFVERIIRISNVWVLIGKINEPLRCQSDFRRELTVKSYSVTTGRSFNTLVPKSGLIIHGLELYWTVKANEIYLPKTITSPTPFSTRASASATVISPFKNFLQFLIKGRYVPQTS